jgi:hypothetical protein
MNNNGDSNPFKIQITKRELRNDIKLKMNIDPSIIIPLEKTEISFKDIKKNEKESKKKISGGKKEPKKVNPGERLIKALQKDRKETFVNINESAKKTEVPKVKESKETIRLDKLKRLKDLLKDLKESE